MKSMKESRISDEELLGKIDCFLKSKEAHLSVNCTDSEFNLFIDIHYLKNMEELLSERSEQNLDYLGMCCNASTKVISETYTVLSPAYLARKQNQLSKSLEKVNKIIQLLLKQAEKYSNLFDPNCWFEWWNEYVEDLTDVEWEYIAECQKQLQKPVKIQPQKTLVQFVIEQQERSKEKCEQPKQVKKQYVEVSA